MAEGIARARIATGGLDHIVDSAGTAGYHEGEPADPRTIEVLRAHGEACSLTSRQVRPADFERFDLLLAMDADNLRNLEAICPPQHRHKLHLMLEPTTGGEVPDPYYGGPGGFEDVYAMLDEAMDAWLVRLT